MVVTYNFTNNKNAKSAKLHPPPPPPPRQTRPDADPLRGRSPRCRPLYQRYIPSHVPAMHSGKPTTVLPQMSTVQKDRMTDACENITLPQTSFTGGKNVVLI